MLLNSNYLVTINAMDVFAALADPVRRHLLRRVADKPARVVDLAAELPISRPAVSKHLRLLAEAGLVSATPSGRETRYALVRAGLDPLHAYLAELATQPPISAHVLDALDLEVRRTVRERRDDPTSEPKKETA